MLSHNKLNGSGKAQANTYELMLMPGKKPRTGVLGHEGEMRCCLGHLYHRGELNLVRISVSLQGQNKRRCSTFIKTSGK